MPTIRGYLGVYSARTAAEVDAHLQRLTTRWAQLTEHTVPTQQMRYRYRSDVDQLLDARTAMRLAEAKA